MPHTPNPLLDLQLQSPVDGRKEAEGAAGRVEGKRTGTGPGEPGTRDISQGPVLSLPARAVANVWLSASGPRPATSFPSTWNIAAACPLFFLADVDECADTDACGEARCRNLPGSYSCLCDEGYEFNSQEKACQGTHPQLMQAPHTHINMCTLMYICAYQCMCNTHHVCITHIWFLVQLGTFSNLL